MLLDRSNNQSGGDAFKKFLAKEGKRAAAKYSQDYLNDKFSEQGANFDFADRLDKGESLKEGVKNNLKSEGRRHGLKAAQDYLNEKLPVPEGGTARFDFANDAADRPLKDVFKEAGKKAATQELKNQGSKLFDAAKEKYPVLGDAQKAFYDPENDDPARRFADIEGTDKEKMKEFLEHAAKESKGPLKGAIRKEFEHYLKQAGKRGVTEEAEHLTNQGLKYGAGSVAKQAARQAIKGEGDQLAKSGLKRFFSNFAEEARKDAGKKLKTGKKGIEWLRDTRAGQSAIRDVGKGVNLGREGVNLANKGLGAIKTGARVLKGAAKVGEKVGELVGKLGAKAGTKAAGGIEVAVEGAGAAGFAGGPLGLVSEILAQLIVIAISLGISDAIDMTEAAIKKDWPKARFHLIRGATKVGLFILFIVLAAIFGAIFPLVGVVIPLVLVHVYWIGSKLPFLSEMAIMQGLVWWEKILLVLTDIFLAGFLAVSVVVILYAYCNVGSLAGSAVAGPVGGLVGGVVDWATTQNGSFCTAFQATGAAINTLTGGTQGSPGTALGDETVGSFTPPAGSCKFSNVNLCKGVVGGNCSNASLVSKVQTEWGPKIDQQIQRYGAIPGVPDTAAFIKSIMLQESGGNPAPARHGSIAGLMQFDTDTSNRYGPMCSNDYDPSLEWREQHPVEMICMAIKYFQSMAAGQCGQPRVEVRNLAAGYNRGPGYCRPADGTYTSCANEKGCDGTPVKSWECLWSDAGHTQCKQYVEEGQQYAQYVFGCYTKLSGSQ